LISHAAAAPFCNIITVTALRKVMPRDMGVRAQEWVPDPVLTRAMDVIMILHMDHEQNASTSTVRVAGSSQANPYACIAAGIACLWGPAHGGANEAVRAIRSPRTRAHPHTHTHTTTHMPISLYGDALAFSPYL
jgi:hypothetical protein